MAVGHSPKGLSRQDSSRPSVSSTTSSASSPQQQTPRLRDSCHGCAASKVKCSKDKPTCARCAKRGQLCEYFATKRAGRKHDSRPSIANANPGQQSSCSNSTVSSRSGISSGMSSSGVSRLTSPSPRHSPPKDSILGFAPGFSNPLFPADPTWSSTFSTFGGDFDDFSQSTGPEFFDTKVFEGPNLGLKDFGNGLRESNPGALFIPDDSFSTFDDAFSNFPTFFNNPASPLNSRDSTAEKQSLGEMGGSEPFACCFVRALGLLKSLFPRASSTCTQSRAQSPELGASPRLPTFNSVIEENEQTIEAICEMLSCPCSQNGYLLAIVSITVFKILGWYAAAARDTPALEEGKMMGAGTSAHQRRFSTDSEQVLKSPTMVGEFSVEGEDHGRIAAQRILSELHRVKRLIHQLSGRIQTYRVRNRAVNTPNGSVDDTEGALPLSTTMLDQFETDLHKRLQTLSLEIVQTLRKN